MSPGLSRHSHAEQWATSPEAGFSLLELLVVVSILAALAAIAAPIYRSADEMAGNQLANAELHRIAAALRQFKQDTGYYPKQGPFAAADDTANLVSPAEMRQLFRAPAVSGAEIMEWSTDTGRGWRGPYLTDFGEGTVVVGNGLAADGTGDPLTGAPITVTGVADPFEKRAAAGLMQWSVGGTEVETRGRPYLYFIDPAANDNVAGCKVPCVLSMGANGDYDAGGGDDIVISLGGQ